MGSYVKSKCLGVIAIDLEKGLGEVDAEGPEGRIPVHPDADRNARSGGVAKEFVTECTDRARHQTDAVRRIDAG